jgi:apolipoprotein N-acyltransferase
MALGNRMQSWSAAAASMGAGFLVAMALPPWGFWPLAPVGLAIYLSLLKVPGRQRAARGFSFGFSLFCLGCAWMFQLTAPGYVVVILLYSTMMAIAAAGARRGRWQLITLVATFTIMEALRFSWPFGGVPVASLPISQAVGPLAPVARIGGPMLLTIVTLLVGVSLASLRRDRRLAAFSAVAVGLLVTLGMIVPHGHGVGSASIAYVQGGGKQGTRAKTDDASLVFERHLAATKMLTGPVDLVVWPENVINVPAFANSRERELVAAEGLRIGAPLAVGVTQDSDNDPNRFLNAQVVVQTDGTMRDQYDKVRRVPFGEFMPLRGLLKSLGAPTDLVPRDAIAGTGPAIVEVPGIGKVGVMISWEVFFGGRGRDAAGSGGKVLLNPTNGASYVGTLLQTQQIASSRLRAIESGRWVVQAAPTGFSAFISPDGEVFQRSAQVEARVENRTIELREGFTPYRTIGDKPWVALAALVFFLTTRRKRGLQLDHDGDRAVVDQADLHAGTEPAGLH